MQTEGYVETVEESVWHVRVGVDNMCFVEESVWQVGMFSIRENNCNNKNMVMIFLLSRKIINSPKNFFAPKIVCYVLKAQKFLQKIPGKDWKFYAALLGNNFYWQCSECNIFLIIWVNTSPLLYATDTIA